jgi:hypothetical protein
MKRTKCMTIAVLLLLAVSGAFAQSLGDYARTVRKKKPETSTARHFDNDNLPTGGTLSVVGPPATDTSARDAKPAAAAVPSPAAEARQKTADEWNQKLEAQKAKIDSLNHELDLNRRELQVRAAQVNADPTLRLRDGGQWDKKQAQFNEDVAEKQKSIDDARHQLEEMQEQAHKAGVPQSDKDDDGKNK